MGNVCGLVEWTYLKGKKINYGINFTNIMVVWNGIDLVAMAVGSQFHASGRYLAKRAW